jgi:hypothetical protein
MIEDADLQLTAARNPKHKVKDFGTRYIITSFGEIHMTRRRYSGTPLGDSYLLDVVLGIPARDKISPVLKEEYAAGASDASYRAVVRSHELYTNRKPSPTSVKGAIEEVAKLMKLEINEKADSYWNKGEAVGTIKTENLLIEADGVYIPRQRTKEDKENKVPKKIEVKVAKSYSGKEEIYDYEEGTVRFKKRSKCLNSVVHATTDDIRPFWNSFMAKTMAKHDFRSVKGGNYGPDGEVKYKNLVNDCGDGFIATLDPFHIEKKINDCIPDDVLAKHFRGLLKEKNDVKRLIMEVGQYLEGQKGAKEKNKTQQLLTYLENNESIIDYSQPTLGTIEATNGHVVADRCKRFGGGWSVEGSNNLLHIRAAQINGDTLPKISRKNKIVGEVPEVIRAKPNSRKRPEPHNPDLAYLEPDGRIICPRLDAIISDVAGGPKRH